MHILEIFFRCFLLGTYAFGGPPAHLAYFREQFVQKLNWLSEDDLAHLIALSQLLPGPGSSQVCFGIGYHRGKLPGAIAAFLGFTMPAFLIMFILATFATNVNDSLTAQSIINGLKLFAVVVVAKASWSFSNRFCTNKITIGIAAVTAAILLLIHSVGIQFLLLLLAALIGFFFLKPEEQKVKEALKTAGRIQWFPLILFMALFIGLPLLSNLSEWIRHTNSFYQSGSMVFGGGHVVLPLLQENLAGRITTDEFLTGYAAAQAIPGPMFSFASYLGTVTAPLGSAFLGATVAVISIFLPGFLLVLGFQHIWKRLTSLPALKGAVNGINAAVTGLLLSALYQPVFTTGVNSTTDAALLILGYFALAIIKLPAPLMVILFGTYGYFIL